MGTEVKVSVKLGGERIATGRVIAKRGSWSTVVLDDGVTVKARNGDITIIEESTDMFNKAEDAATEVTATEPVAEVTTETATAEVAEKAAPVSRARPAHNVGEVKPDAKGKIGGTVFDLTKYHVSEVKTESGRRTIDTNDEVAQQLRGLPLEAVYEAAAAARGVPVAELKAKYEHLNAGMQRMNLGNQIRGAESAKLQAAAKAEKAAAKALADAARAEAKAKADAEKAAAKAAREEAAAAAKAAKEAAKAAAPVEATA